MSFSSAIGTISALAVVLGLLLITAAAFRRFAPKLARGTKVLELEVLQRLVVGTKQGLAVVRMGERFVVVSVGEGGVRLVADVTSDVAAARAAQPAKEPQESFSLAGAGTQFRQALKSAIGVRNALILAAGLAFAAGPSAARAQTALNAPATPSSSVSGPTTSAAPVTPARVDTMISRLAPQMQLSIGAEKSGGLKLSGTVGIVVMMGLLTLLPAVVLMMTGFTRILIVLNFLRQAIGAQSAPPAQLVAGLALLLTLFVMAPTIDEVNTTALGPWMDGKITQTQMIAEASKPFRAFMLRQTRESDLATFVRLSHAPIPDKAEDVSLVVLTSAFVTSELRVAFQIGFALFLPFIVIDIVVAAVLMSMGMMMVPPAMISLPFKLLLFVLVDGWSLVVQGLVQSFH